MVAAAVGRLLSRLAALSTPPLVVVEGSRLAATAGQLPPLPPLPPQPPQLHLKVGCSGCAAELAAAGAAGWRPRLWAPEGYRLTVPAAAGEPATLAAEGHAGLLHGLELVGQLAFRGRLAVAAAAWGGAAVPLSLGLPGGLVVRHCPLPRVLHCLRG